MYKDKDKQREANRKAQAKFKAKGITEGITNQGITMRVLPEFKKKVQVRPPVLPSARDKAIEFMSKEAGITERAKPKRTAQGNIRVSKPGDADYEPQCETTRAFVEGRDKQPSTTKRGKDVKMFEDLPPDVQATIKTVSSTNEEFQKRTAAAIRYQHLFPDRYHTTGTT